MVPFSSVASKLIPISMGSMLSLVSMVAKPALISSPSFAARVSSLMVTFPSWMVALMPRLPSSPMTGPGLKGVGPAGTKIS